jgi:hypothetical protein
MPELLGAEEPMEGLKNKNALPSTTREVKAVTGRELAKYSLMAFRLSGEGGVHPCGIVQVRQWESTRCG